MGYELPSVISKDLSGKEESKTELLEKQVEEPTTTVKKTVIEEEKDITQKDIDDIPGEFKPCK